MQMCAGLVRPFRSQMLYPVELRAPVRESVNLRSNDRTVKSCWKKNTTALETRIDFGGTQGYGGIANSIRPAVQTDQTGVFRTQVTKNKSRLFIRETGQPEKPL
jgi:hypothetical protein